MRNTKEINQYDIGEQLVRVGNNIKYLRMLNGMKQYELAKLLGVTRESISRYESGNSIIKADSIIKLSNIFHVSVEDLFNATLSSENIGRIAALTNQLKNYSEEVERIKKLLRDERARSAMMHRKLRQHSIDTDYTNEEISAMLSDDLLMDKWILDYIEGKYGKVKKDAFYRSLTGEQVHSIFIKLRGNLEGINSIEQLNHEINRIRKDAIEYGGITFNEVFNPKS